MKVAVLYPGMPRVNQERLENHRRHLLDRHDCDVFISTYDSNDRQRQQERSSGHSSGLVDDEIEFIKYYLPSCVEIQNEDQLCAEKIQPAWNMLSSMGMTCPAGINPLISLMQFYKINRCYDMMLQHAARTNTSYDVVLRTRFDNLFEETLPLQINSFLNIPYGSDWPGGFYDHMAFGDVQVMGEYCRLYSGLESGSHLERFPILHSERVVRWNAELRNLPVRRFGFRVYLRTMKWWFNHWAEVSGIQQICGDAQQGIVKNFKVLCNGTAFYYNGTEHADRSDPNNYTLQAPDPLPWPV